MKKFLAIILSITTLLSMVTMTTSAAEQSAKVFSDVKKDHWAYEAVTALSSSGVIAGYTDGNFKPDAPVTRAEWAKMLCVSAGLESTGAIDIELKDIEKTDWYASYASAVSDYIPLYVDGEDVYFGPDEKATREDVTISLVAVKDYIIEIADKNSALSFADSDSITEDYLLYVASAVEKKLITGFEDNTFRPQGTLTRAEAATLLHRAFYGEDEKLDAAVETELKSIVTEYKNKLMNFDITALEYIKKDTSEYTEVQSYLNIEDVIRLQISLYGMTEAQQEKFVQIEMDAVKKQIATYTFEVEKVIVDGDNAKVVGKETMLNNGEVDTDFTSYLTDEEAEEHQKKVETLSPEEVIEYTYDVMLDVMPRIYEEAFKKAQSKIVTTHTLLQKVDGKWLIIDGAL